MQRVKANTWGRAASLNILSTFLLLVIYAFPAHSNPPSLVTAAGETVVKDNPKVDADDPAIWADTNDPSRGLIFTTDKTLGLYVHNLDGSVRQFFASGPLDNVDLRTGFIVDGKEQVLVAASERKRYGIMLYLLDPESLTTRFWGFVPTHLDEPYGFCMGKRGDNFYLVVNNKSGDIHQIRVESSRDGPAATLVNKRKLQSQTEGCVVDDIAQKLYVGEEDVAIWQFDFDPDAESQATLIDSVSGQYLTADIEGLTIMRDKGSNYLIASSQGDSTFAVYRMNNNDFHFVGRFHITDSDITDEVTLTDGVDAWSGPIGNFPEGLIVVHDDDDKPLPGQQNYKLIDWRVVKAALKIDNTPAS